MEAADYPQTVKQYMFIKRLKKTKNGAVCHYYGNNKDVVIKLEKIS